MSKLAASARSDQARALLALADGTVFEGISFGAPTTQVGEVVFNTSLTGYQEIATDPSYCRQIVTLTYPHIGNVGTNAQDEESGQLCLSGLVIKDLPMLVSNFRSSQPLGDYLKQHGVPGIAGIDTRKLTRILREKGAQNGCLMTEGSGETFSAERAVELARGFPGLAGMDLAKVVSCTEIHEWTEGEWTLGEAAEVPHFQQGDRPYHVVAYDFGAKRNILRMLAQRGCRVTVVPAQTAIDKVLALNPDGVFLSNGPGDPEPCDYAIAAIKHVLEQTKLPVFGICLGHQLMALASGAKTLKMKFGHHGANHPVQELSSKRVFITSQNHGFAVDPESLPANLRVTHVSLFDGSIQGLERTDRAAFCFQGHPEASPGPHDLAELFDRFIADIRACKQ
ncbi:glutamine-hydrolyzing carbamoyl-phosphate synthase small subunit [Limnobacter humi]|uniref:Carbamoyl phosphate synthase small chain n=1 Tax=Limnobacter humi TaxID=1778671 RepID=A0ABT1WBJ8_9BURK|nr:glutamine-hydrolyzing carbamoyl-phosphate synthase small subunit [Limnobacter humi]MCQ8894880.1 glutamine-hydrolyzing carbamoyl-phosphate synthase small subunit [Limnobacter humi]